MELKNLGRYKHIKLLFFITNPLFLVIFWNFIALTLFLITPQDLMISFAKESKYYTFHSVFLYIIFTLSFILGYLVYPKKAIHNKNYNNIYMQSMRFRKVIKLSAYITFILTLIGYLIWFKDIYLNLRYYLIVLFQEGSYHIRDFLQEHMISGITTFTQFGIVSSILFLILYFTHKKKRIYLFFILLVLFLSILRAIFFGERLAVLEIIIPLTFIYLRFKPYRSRTFILLGLLFFIVLWSSELLRSYKSPAYYGKYTPLEYLVYRFGMYFTTTINNAFIIFDKFYPLQDLFPETLKFFYKFINYYPESHKIYKELLENYLNPEYNNKSAWGSIYFDWGMFGIIFSAFIGMLSRHFYVQYKRNNLWGVLIYPIFMVFLLQSYRILYINSSRVIYPFITILLLYLAYNYINSTKYNINTK